MELVWPVPISAYLRRKEKRWSPAQCQMWDCDKMKSERSDRPERNGFLLDHIVRGKRFVLHLSAIWGLEVYGGGIACSVVCQWEFTVLNILWSRRVLRIVCRSQERGRTKRGWMGARMSPLIWLWVRWTVTIGKNQWGGLGAYVSKGLGVGLE